MNMMQAHVPCENRDCHANVAGMCNALESAFTTKPCPFYKTDKRLNAELAALIDGDWDAYHRAQRIK